MDENRIKLLLQGYKAGTLSEAEIAEWEQAMELAETRQMLQQLMEVEMLAVKDAGDFDMQPWKPVLARILSLDKPEAHATEEMPSGRTYRMRKWTWAAAAILVLLTAGTIYLFTNKTATAPPVVAKKLQEIGPGKEGAVLTLSDGRQVVLDSLANGIVAMEDGAQVTLKNGQLQYAQLESASKEVQYNTMTTPRGRQFMITLPDGTEVWLNAASSIRFPVEFNSTERRVEVTGEAFFHVKSLKLPAFNGSRAIKVPFVVNVNKQMEVEVLGTQFNVNAYTNEKAINTTLTEGVVRVSTNETKDEPSQMAMLIPGQQASLKNDGGRKITVQEADLGKVMAWKNGLFNFENVSLADAMMQLERWYDIDVAYENGIPNIWFSGKISRETNLTGLLKILEKTGVQFRLEGRKLIVLQGN
ncbi:FecR family protein [Pseudoflavitalea rhizosphaerae]|uniref:FecR family protein n=1 Tax=Pseudoflavitalea rhizosphaerae TaxID=1884793 RepID=UPI000F8D595C|nr:FecR family protein [Pseudoflavitalea rhizosphaerae]